MKSFTRTVFAFSLAAAFSAVSLLAQRPGPGRGGEHFLETALDMTAAQTTQHQTIMANEHAASKALMTQLRTQREAVEQAIESGQSAEQVSQLAAQEGTLLGQLEGVRASARQQLYSILTPAQQQKMIALQQHSGFRGGRGGPGAGPAQ